MLDAILIILFVVATGVVVGLLLSSYLFDDADERVRRFRTWGEDVVVNVFRNSNEEVKTSHRLKFKQEEIILVDQDGYPVTSEYQTRVFASKKQVRELCKKLKGLIRIWEGREMVIDDASYIYSHKYNGAIITIKVTDIHRLKMFNDRKIAEFEHWKNA